MRTTCGGTVNHVLESKGYSKLDTHPLADREARKEKLGQDLSDEKENEPKKTTEDEEAL